MLKWTVLYNSSFSNNHKSLFEEVQKLHRQGKLELVRQCDFVKNDDNINLLLTQDLKSILTPKTLKEVETYKSMSEIAKKVVKNPKKALRSVISLWYYDIWDEITRLDVGEVELKYLLESERRLPKWN